MRAPRGLYVDAGAATPTTPADAPGGTRARPRCTTPPTHGDTAGAQAGPHGSTRLARPRDSGSECSGSCSESQLRQISSGSPKTSTGPTSTRSPSSSWTATSARQREHSSNRSADPSAYRTSAKCSTASLEQLSHGLTARPSRRAGQRFGGPRCHTRGDLRQLREPRQDVQVVASSLDRVRHVQQLFVALATPGLQPLRLLV